MKRYAVIVVALVMLASYSCQQQIDHPGYTLISKKFVREVNADCFYFEHDKSGAKVFKIAADDPNKTFSIAFQTITDTDCGTPHIMEHCVLDGSKNFPVKSTFDEISKGSLATFLNAMTSKDMTMYPGASMNTKDYFNLMHVYFDAVFNPLVLERPNTFYQEGWHHELLDPDEPVVYKGVVYNEMKGAFSSPDRELYYQTNKHLFPDNCYQYTSGGRPEAIPELTYEQFIDYYKKHYHPSNSYIFLYGDADLERELAFIDTAYLSAYERSDMELEIPMHEPFSGLKEVVEPYSVPSGADTKDQAMLRLSFVVGDGTDMEQELAMMIIQDVLVNQESAPLRLALQEAGIGQDITAYASTLRQRTFHMTVKNANAGERERFRETVFKTLEQVVEEGLDKEAIEGTINRLEFRLREGDDAQKGITCMNWIINNWIYIGDPYLGMEYEEPLAKVKSALTSDYLEQIIREKIINNPHALLLVLEPEPGLEGEISENTTGKLARYKAGLNEEEIAALIQSTEELVAYQERNDTPEALATIPKLGLDDVNPESEWSEVQEKDADGQKILYYEAFTNSVLYISFMFDMRTVDQDMIPYVSILSELLGKMDTENFSCEDLEKNLNIHTGGFNSNMVTYLDSKKDDQLLPKFGINVKAINNKTDQLIALVEEIILRTDYSDTTRIRNLLNKHLARIEANVKANGFGYARTRQRSYHSPEGVFSETSGGVSYYWFLKELMGAYDDRAEELVQKLTLLSGSMFTRSNLIIGVTCDQGDYPSLESRLASLVQRFPDQTPDLHDWALVPEIKNEGLMAASKVQYVLQGANFKALGHDFSGHMLVLNNVMDSEWLHPQIRVKGGAYGGFGRFSKNGEVYFASYRDPNLGETLENFAGTSSFVKNFEADSAEMTQFIIGTIATLDVPRTPSQKGKLAVRNYLTNYTASEHQQIRDEVLSTTLEDLHALVPMVTEVIGQNAYCVYGNQEKIQANKQLFDSVISIAESVAD
jgi:Zn-dependent M16 (insulinase) family peptidase